MKKGFSMFSFNESIDYKRIFSFVKEAGYDGVEPVLGNEGYLNMNSTEAQILEVKKSADYYGLSIPSVGVWSLWDNNLVSNDKKIREHAKDIVKKELEIAAAFLADTVLVIPGYVGCDFAKKYERVRYDYAYDRCVEAFLELADIAKKYHVNIGVENVWNQFLLSPIEVRRLCEDINSDYFGVYFDVGNILYIGYPDDWIEILGKYIKKIHLSDYRKSQAGLGAFVDLLAGDVDFGAVAKALNTIGYNDYMTLEMLPNYKVFPEISIFSNKFAVDKICEIIEKSR